MQSLLQTQEWAMVKENQGWRVHWVEEILVLEKSLPLGFSFLYAPEVDFYKIKNDTFYAKIKEIAKKNKTIFTRLDFINQKSSIINKKIPKILANFGLIKSFEEIQPEFRQIINITGSEEHILAHMKPKGRYNIKVAQKYQVSCIKYKGLETQEGIDIFYDLFKKTASRDGFGIRPKKYFEDLVKILQEKNLVEVLVARYNGKAVAAGIFTFYGDMASYLYGASSNENRQVMAPYLMHLEVIREAKKRNCKFYDLLAIEPFRHPEPAGEGSQGILRPAQNDRKHKYAGITRFKEQFGGVKIQTMGSWDMVHKPVLYQLFKIAEKARRK